MCVEIKNTSEIKKFTVKKMFKSIFKKHQNDTIESLENELNLGIAENLANQKIAEIQEEEEEFVPVKFVQTEMGTVFFIQAANSKELPAFHFQDRWAQA